MIFKIIIGAKSLQRALLWGVGGLIWGISRAIAIHTLDFIVLWIVPNEGYLWSSILPIRCELQIQFEHNTR